MRDCGRGSTSWGAVTKEQRALEAAQKEMAQLPVPRSRPNLSSVLCRSWTWTRTGSSTLFRLCPGGNRTKGATGDLGGDRPFLLRLVQVAKSSFRGAPEGSCVRVSRLRSGIFNRCSRLQGQEITAN